MLKVHRIRPAARSIPRGRVSSCNRKSPTYQQNPPCSGTRIPWVLPGAAWPLCHPPSSHPKPTIRKSTLFPFLLVSFSRRYTITSDGILAKQSTLSRLKTVPPPGEGQSSGGSTGQGSGSQSGEPQPSQVPQLSHNPQPSHVPQPSHCGPAGPQYTQFALSCGGDHQTAQCQDPSLVRHPAFPVFLFPFFSFPTLLLFRLGNRRPEN